MQVHEIILQQLGGRQFIAMTGAQNLAYGENCFHCKIRGSKKVSHLKITLNSMDTYDIEYVKIWGTKMTVVEESNGIYNDMLKQDIENVTGLYLSL